MKQGFTRPEAHANEVIYKIKNKKITINKTGSESLANEWPDA